MLCTAGHNNADNAAFCRVCGVNTFSAPSIVVKQSSEFNIAAGIVLGWVGVAGVVFIIFFVTAIFHSVHFTPCAPNCQP